MFNSVWARQTQANYNRWTCSDQRHATSYMLNQIWRQRFNDTWLTRQPCMYSLLRHMNNDENNNKQQTTQSRQAGLGLNCWLSDMVQVSITYYESAFWRNKRWLTEKVELVLESVKYHRKSQQASHKPCNWLSSNKTKENFPWIWSLAQKCVTSRCDCM